MCTVDCPVNPATVAASDTVGSLPDGVDLPDRHAYSESTPGLDPEVLHESPTF